VDVVLFVGPELLHELRVLEEGDERGGGLLERPEPGDDLGAALDHVLGDVVGVVEGLVDVHGIVDHVGAAEEADLGLQELGLRVELPLLEELQQREHQVPVQLRCHQRREVMLRHGWCSELSPSCLPEAARVRVPFGFEGGGGAGRKEARRGSGEGLGLGFGGFVVRLPIDVVPRLNGRPDEDSSFGPFFW